MAAEIPVIIPAYQPAMPLVQVVEALVARGVREIVVVDDGSAARCHEFFAAVSALPGVRVVRHAVNLGKGAALKSGINAALCEWPQCVGVVTADADGQHHPDDIVRVAARLRQQAEALVLGVRKFRGDVPARSRIGNELTRKAVRVLIGQRLADTQTGLRGIPRHLLSHLLRMQSSGYEFELDMLIACKHQSCPIVEEEIQTIYLEGNQSSHFSPVVDSMRIYFVLLRFGALSALTALVDNLVFLLVYRLTGSVPEAQASGRVVALIFNYLGARSVVFHSQQKHQVVLPKYLALVCFSGLVSYGLLTFLRSTFGWNVIPAKLAAETLLFVANFAIQRDFVFTKRRARPSATDWDSYYKSVPATAKVTRQYTTNVLLSLMKKFLGARREQAELLEIGGANSCFFDAIMSEIKPRVYHVVDTNEYGLQLLRERAAECGDAVRTYQQSVLELQLERPADLVFSVGLVEHFDPGATREAVLAHFDVVRPGGYVVITFPTPTLLYRITRQSIEAVGMWKFHDERPLTPGEVIAAGLERGAVVFEKMMWPLVLTQYLVVFQKHGEPQQAAMPASQGQQPIPAV